MNTTEKIKKRPKVAISVSHPIQHFCPQYISYHNNPNWITKVFFASSLGHKPYEDKDFKETVSWNNLRLDEFDHEFLNGETVLSVTTKLDAPKIGESLNKYNPDVIIIYGYIQKFQRRALDWAQKNNVKIFFLGDSELAHKRSFLKSLLKKIILTQYFKKIDRVLTVGNSNEHYYYNYGVPLKKMTRVGFSFDLKLYQDSYLEKENLRKTIRSKNGIQHDNITLTVVGKLITRKRQKDIISVLSLLEQKSSQKYTLFIIGSGPDEKELKSMAKKLKYNRVIFTGFTIPEDLPAYYAATDIYVHPATMEPHSLAISEAGYMDCALIVSDTCGSHGPTDDVQSGRNGFIYTHRNVEELASRIARIAKDPALLKSFAQNAHDIMVKNQERAHYSGLHTALLAENLL